MRVVDLYEEIEHEWVRRIVNFDRYDQIAILKALRNLVFSDASLGDFRSSNLRIVVPAAGATTVLLFMVILLVRRRRTEKSEASTIYLTTMQEMVEQGALTRVHSWHEENTREIEQSLSHNRA